MNESDVGAGLKSQVVHSILQRSVFTLRVTRRQDVYQSEITKICLLVL